MIHQCFYRESQRGNLFATMPGLDAIYSGFGLEPDVNPDLLRNCPELTSPAHRQHLCEFAAMLHLWRNPNRDSDDWIGFTSYRQLDKSRFIFRSRKKIERILDHYDGIGWNYLEFDTTLTTQTEKSVPGITQYLLERLGDEGDGPLRLRTGDFYANYWILRRDAFNQFMTWIYPHITGGLEDMRSHRFFLDSSHPRLLGVVLERLFIVWYHGVGLRIRNVGFSSRLRQLASSTPRFMRRIARMRHLGIASASRI